jgi:serine/threonine protein kinase/Tfp pilus assembly protein PilF
MITPKRWKEIDGIFAAALEHDSAERPKFLDEACGGDAELRKEVESLIAHIVPGSLVEAPAAEEATRLLASERYETPLTTIGPYQVVRLLGAGGMGKVYLTYDPRLNRPVAVKLLSHYGAAEEERSRRFRQEALAASALNHPNILTIHEISDFEGQDYIATEFIDGVTLRARLSGGEMPFATALEFATQIAAALSAAHEAGIVHRDIKPENAMVRADGLVKVLDFGIAKYTQAVGVQDQDLVETKPGVVVGTAPYMSPEQARGLPVDARTDVWSLGVMLYEMVAGRVPFVGKTASETVSLILQKQPAPLARYAPDVPAELERIVTKALTKDREERYQTAKDMLIDLRNLKRKLEVDAEIERTVSPAPGSPQSTSSGQIVPATVSGSVAATAPANDSHSASSAEFVVSGIKQHKLAAILVLVVLIGSAVGLGLYLHARNTEVAIDSIAVLPFENKSTEPDADYLSDGLADSLLYRLSQLPNLKVSPSSSVLRYKGKEIDAVKVGQDLGVNAVLSGRIVQRGDNLTISIELVDVRYNKLLWGEQYERKISDLLATQREIAQEIVEKLKLKVSGEEKVLAKHYTESNEAYQLYLKGRFYWNKRTAEALTKAIEYFNQAIEKDPGFALAYAGLANCYVLHHGNAQPPREKMPKARAAAMRALELDETLSEAHTSLARVMAVYDWDWPGAEKEFRRAIELNPRDALAHQWYGGYFELMGRRDEALAERKKALDLDPLSLASNSELGLAYYFARDYDKAIEQFRMALELDPNFPLATAQLPVNYDLKGMYDQAIAGFQKLATQRGDTRWSNALAGLGHAYAMSGKKAEARAVLAELKQRSQQEYVPADSIALVYTGLGEKDEAFTWLEKAYEDHAFKMAWLKVEPQWDSLRSDPRFADLLRRMRLTQ